MTEVAIRPCYTLNAKARKKKCVGASSLTMTHTASQCDCSDANELHTSSRGKRVRGGVRSLSAQP